MYFHSDTVINTAGSAIAGATVTVYQSSGALAALYSDNGITPTVNPFTTNSAGGLSFYAAAGTYTIVISGSGIVPTPAAFSLGATAANFSDQETPAGLTNGSNTVFTVANLPSPSTSLSAMIRQGGKGAFLPMNQPIDYTVSGKTVTLTNAPTTGSNLAFSYRYQ